MASLELYIITLSTNLTGLGRSMTTFSPSNDLTHASGRGKTICTSSVLSFFGIDPGEYHYSDHSRDVKNILRRKGYSVRSRASALGLSKGLTVGELRKKLKAYDGCESNAYYLGVKGHAMVIAGNGVTLVDTAPRKRDRRQVVHIQLITKS